MKNLPAMLVLLTVAVLGCQPPTSLRDSEDQNPEAPIFSPAGGAYSVDQSVALSSKTEGAVVHYTTDGSTPTASSATYNGPIAVTGPTGSLTIKAIAMTSGGASSVAESSYSVTWGQTPIPTISPQTGTYSTDQSVTITAEPGASIYYTLDGSTPTTSSTVYAGSITVAGDGTVKTVRAIAVTARAMISSVAESVVTIGYGQTSTPQFSPAPGTYSNDQTITLSTSTPGATISYTLNGGASTTYTGPISIAGNGSTHTIVATASEAGGKASAANTGTWKIAYPVQSPSVPQKTSIPVPSAYQDVAGAAYLIRAAGPITRSAARSARVAVSGNAVGIAVGDPVAPYCTDPGSLYWFLDDNSVTQFVAIDTAAYASLKSRAALSVEGQNTLRPDKPWGYIANDPVTTPVGYQNDPILNVGEIAIVYNSDNGEICSGGGMTYFWALTTLADYNRAVGLMPTILAQWNTLNPANQGHVVYGGAPAE